MFFKLEQSIDSVSLLSWILIQWDGSWIKWVRYRDGAVVLHREVGAVTPTMQPTNSAAQWDLHNRKFLNLMMIAIEFG